MNLNSKSIKYWRMKLKKTIKKNLTLKDKIKENKKDRKKSK
jgi:hypothetical protein